jgi:hypothetical protein
MKSLLYLYFAKYVESLCGNGISAVPTKDNVYQLKRSEGSGGSGSSLTSEGYLEDGKRRSTDSIRISAAIAAVA